MNFILNFKYYVSNAWRCSVQPKHVACIGGINKICCGWRQYVCQFLIWIKTTMTRTSHSLHLLRNGVRGVVSGFWDVFFISGRFTDRIQVRAIDSLRLLVVFTSLAEKMSQCPLKYTTNLTFEIFFRIVLYNCMDTSSPHSRGWYSVIKLTDKTNKKCWLFSNSFWNPLIILTKKKMSKERNTSGALAWK